MDSQPCHIYSNTSTDRRPLEKTAPIPSQSCSSAANSATRGEERSRYSGPHISPASVRCEREYSSTTRSSNHPSGLAPIGEVPCLPSAQARSEYDASIVARLPRSVFVSGGSRPASHMLDIPNMLNPEVPTISPQGSSKYASHTEQVTQRKRHTLESRPWEDLYDTSMNRSIRPIECLSRTSSPSTSIDTEPSREPSKEPDIVPLSGQHTYEPLPPTPESVVPSSPAQHSHGHPEDVSSSPSERFSHLPTTDVGDEYLQPSKSGSGSWMCVWKSADFPSEMCGYTAKRNLVRRHVSSVHLTIRPFVCEHCKKRFAQKTNFQTHLNTHTGARPYKCPDCNASFGDPSGKHRHMKHAHDYKPKVTKKPIYAEKGARP